MTPAPAFRPGFVVLHGNRVEDLADAALAWLARHPLGPLDEETLLAPSSGMAEWLKGAMATRHGIAAGFRIELPAQFVWRAWRAVLGDAAVPAASPLDKAPLAWWLMRLLPALAPQPVFAPLAQFLAVDHAPLRRLQLARRLADLFDQYQVYRPDWLDDWAAGRDRLARVPGDRAAPPLPPGQRWQAALWRALLAELRDGAVKAAGESRPALHRRFVDALNARPEGSPPPGLPPRLLLFGTTHLPHTTLEALAALARHIPVLLAVPDPCQVPTWADDVPDAAQAPPLLQAWGRQCRDFVRQLQAHDDGAARAEQLGLLRTALFDEAPATTMLQQLQTRIRLFTPPGEKALPTADDDRSLQFHTAHGPMREVELLHDQLLEAFSGPGRQPGLEPRDVVVMVPDIERFAPAIAAVFGRFPAGHPRHIPWGLADRRERGRHALLRTLEALLQVRERRFGASELRDWLATPALAARFALDEAQVEQAAAWMAGAGARWGLHEAQRASLGLGAAGAVGTWRFALDRLLMGYATGALPPEAEPPGGIDPWPEVAGLDAALAGTLAQLLERLDAWWAEAAEPRLPAAWLPRLRGLLTSMFTASAGAEGDRERTLLAMLDEALLAWVQACDAAGFDEPVALDVVREAWLAGLDEGGGGRFRAGGVTFCTLLPLRAIPFRWVCLLGMNDGEYPRAASRSDFDLMADPALARPGDRSRRDDDRQLMLDALLAARERLHVSWSAHSARDAQPQPPSVLVQQLRDEVKVLWGKDRLEALTLDHPLQPFSRRYIEVPADGDERLYTHAHEWRVLHEPGSPPNPTVPASPSATAAPAVLRQPTLKQLADFVRRPVEAWFRERLRTRLLRHEDESSDDEPFVDGGLDGWQWRDELLGALAADDAGRTAPRLAAAVARLRREGRLPWGGPGEAVSHALQAEVAPVLQAWSRLRDTHASPASREPLRLALEQAEVDAGLLPWFEAADGPPRLLQLSASRLAAGKDKKLRLRADKLVTAWLQQLAMAASGRPAGLCVIGIDRIVQGEPLAEAPSRQTLEDLVEAWREATGDDGPWPTALATALALLEEGGDPRRVFESGPKRRGDDQDPHLARVFPSFDALTADSRFEPVSERLYTPLATWLATLTHEPLPDAVAAADDADDEDAADG